MNRSEHKPIDLRSDTVTLPSEAMKAEMCCAPVGDDVMGEDPTVKAFQREVADLLGKESALFLPTATQANLTAILSQCQRGEEYIVGDAAHCYRWEAGGAAVLGSVQPQPLPLEADGTLDLENVIAHIKPDDPHYAITKLLCIENTQRGKVLPLEYIEQARMKVCDQYGLRLHMDGARLFNASVALGVPVREIVQHVDTITLCFSKGLGCPAGALLVGDKECILKAVRWRKMLGGGMRQAGMLAAAGQYALKHHVERLAEDHSNAERLAEAFWAFDDPNLVVEGHATNMAFVRLGDSFVGNLQAYAKERGVLLPRGKQLRLVTHRDVTQEDVEVVVSTVRDAFCVMQK